MNKLAIRTSSAAARLAIVAFTACGAATAAADVKLNETYLGNATVISEVSFDAVNGLTSFTINATFNNQGNLTYASDLIIGIIDPGGSAIEFGPAAVDSGSLDFRLTVAAEVAAGG